MNQHEYIAGFYGVLIGFTMTELIRGTAEILKNTQRIRYYYPHGIVVISIFFTIVLLFFDFFEYFEKTAAWTPLDLMIYSFPAIFCCFLSYLMFPTFQAEHEVNFREYYFKICLKVWGVIAVLCVLTLMRDLFLMDISPLNTSSLIMYLIILLSFVGVFSRRDWVHHVLSLILLSAVVYWTLNFYLK